MKKNETKNGKKKNVMMRVASALGILVLLTCCVISGTFAKYTTEVESQTTARVAKWGFETKNSEDKNLLTIDDLFATSYKDGKVQSSKAGDKVIAPGASNVVIFSYKYDATSNEIAKPEVAYNFVVKATGTIGDSIKSNKNIKWYLDDNLAGEGEAAGSWDALLTAIGALSQENVQAGHLPTTFYGAEENPDQPHTIGWKWLFDGSVQDAVDLDAMDTAMGNADSLETVTLKITITATQVNN